MLLLSYSVSAGQATAIDLALIEPADLAQKQGAWTVLDARPKAEWLAGHIPGSYSFSWEDYTRTDQKGIPYRAWPPRDLANALGEMGIDENTPIIVYGDAEKSWGGEGWTCWALARLGHQGPVRLLSGGIQSWRDRGLPMTAGAKKRAQAPVCYQPTLRPEPDIEASELEEKGASMVLIDTRSTIEWWKGHMPGAIHIPWTDFYGGKDRHPLTPDALRALLKDHGVDTGMPVVYYCTGGVRSGYAWMVHQLSGLPPARNYEGGMEEWKRHTAKLARNVPPVDVIQKR